MQSWNLQLDRVEFEKVPAVQRETRVRTLLDTIRPKDQPDDSGSRADPRVRPSLPLELVCDHIVFDSAIHQSLPHSLAMQRTGRPHPWHGLCSLGCATGPMR
jgi:hypothetical protein